MKIYVLVTMWAIIILSLGALVTTLVIVCCDPREKSERRDEKVARSPRRHEEDYHVET